MWRRVLIVDDNRAFRVAARQLLERGNFVVVAEAETGVTALQEAADHEPDLAIVDVQLPDSDGFEVVEQLFALDMAMALILTSSLDGTDFGLLLATSPAIGFIPKAELSILAIERVLAQPK